MTFFNTSDAIKMYLSGQSLREIAKYFGTNHHFVKRRIKKAGIGIRPRSEEASTKLKAMWASMTREERTIRQQTIVTKEVRAKIALTRQKTLLESGKQEDLLVTELRTKGVLCTPERAIGTYNIDIAFDVFPIAVEVDAGECFYRKSIGVKRTKYLLGREWCVLYVLHQGFGIVDRIIPITNKILSLLDMARRGEPIFGKYGVINRKGKTLTTARSYLNDLPRIQGF